MKFRIKVSGFKKIPTIDYVKLNEKRKICCNCKYFDGFGCTKGLETACSEVVDCQDCLERFLCLTKPYCALFEPNESLKVREKREEMEADLERFRRGCFG